MRARKPEVKLKQPSDHASSALKRVASRSTNLRDHV
jgi:hypothetical protein